MNTRLYGILRYMDTTVYGYYGIWILRYMDTTVYEYYGIWIVLRYMDTTAKGLLSSILVTGA